MIPKKLSSVAIIIISIFFLWKFLEFKRFKQTNFIDQDVIFYYSYLPAIFIHHDIKLTFTDGGKEGNHFWPEKAPNGNTIIKMTCGMSILYSPFFFIGHGLAQLLGYETNGYSIPYGFALYLGTIIYVIIGFIFLRKILLLYFEEKIVALTLLTLGLGTNLFYQSTLEALLTHAYTFTLGAIFLFLTIKWHNKPTVIKSILIGLIGGLIVLIRPVNVLVVLVFILYQIYNSASLKNKVIFFKSNFHYLLLILSASFLMFVPQLLYWHYITGNWVYYSYQKESFFFSNPHIAEGLFSYRKGWLLYTPVMSFSILGMLFLKKNIPEYFYTLIILFIVTVYVTFSWWCWWYGGTFSQRTMVDFYPYLSISLALFFKKLLESKFLVPGLCLTAFFIFLNIYQTYQFKKSQIHWEAMTQKAYWDVFIRDKRWNPYDLKKPDVANAYKGIDEY